MRLWDVQSRKEIKRFEGHETWVWSVALSTDGRLAASGSGTHNVDAARGRPGDCFARVWDVETGRELRRFESFREVVTLCFASGGRRILFGGAEAKLRLGDTENGRELHRFAGHRGVVQSVAISSDGRYAVSASLDGTLRLWELPHAPPSKEQVTPE
jgi:WD40 repeat protein